MVESKNQCQDIYVFWNSRAGFGQTASTRDIVLKQLEIRAILKYVSDGMRVLDAGCGNGITAIKVASRYNVHIVAFVFASSYLVYSPGLYIFKKPTKETVLRESERVKPRNICGAAKFYTEWEMDFAREHFNPSMRTVSARIFRVYGLDSREIINRWVRSILAGRKIEVYNRQNRFDYIFSRDVAEGLLHIAVSPEARGCINLSSGYAKSIDDVLQILAKYLPETESLIIDQGVQDVFETSCGNLTLLKKMTGWNPSRSLEEGIKLIIEYEQPKKPRRVA